MAAVPNILHVSQSNKYNEMVYIVSPNEKVSKEILEMYRRNNPKTCEWIDEHKHMAMTWAAFNLFCYGPFDGLLTQINSEDIPTKKEEHKRYKNELLGITIFDNYIKTKNAAFHKTFKNK